MGVKTKGILQRKIDKQIYEVDYKHSNIFDLPRGSKDRLQVLKRYVQKECEKAWALLPREVATLKREYLRELIDSL